jgi:hypothetical protein
MEQLRQTSSDQLRPTVTSGGQPEPECDPFWTTLTRYVSDPGSLLPSRFETVHSTVAPWRHAEFLGGSCPFFSTDIVTSRSGGGRGAIADCEAIVSAVDTHVPDQFQHRHVHCCRLRPGHASSATRCTNQQDRTCSTTRPHLQTAGRHHTSTRTSNSS